MIVIDFMLGEPSFQAGAETARGVCRQFRTKQIDGNGQMKIQFSLYSRQVDDAEFASTLLPGTSADIEVILEERKDVLRIPTGSLMEGNRALVLAGGLPEERQLEIGLRNWNFTEVRSGLSEGDKVVISLDRVEVADGAEAIESTEE